MGHSIVFSIHLSIATPLKACLQRTSILRHMSHSHYLQKCQPLTNLLSGATLYIYLESLHGGDKCHSIGYIQGLTRLISRHMALHIATYLGTKATLAYLDTFSYNRVGHMYHSLGHNSLYTLLLPRWLTWAFSNQERKRHGMRSEKVSSEMGCGEQDQLTKRSKTGVSLKRDLDGY